MNLYLDVVFVFCILEFPSDVQVMCVFDFISVSIVHQWCMSMGIFLHLTLEMCCGSYCFFALRFVWLISALEIFWTLYSLSLFLYLSLVHSVCELNIQLYPKLFWLIFQFRVKFQYYDLFGFKWIHVDRS